VKAKAIIAYRQQNSPFKSVDDLKKVSGIGDKLLAQLKDQVTVSK
jgi:competence protein ComEA